MPGSDKSWMTVAPGIRKKNNENRIKTVALKYRQIPIRTGTDVDLVVGISPPKFFSFVIS
jgi:hypothetical protein